jgi:hypothetical protein
MPGLIYIALGDPLQKRNYYRTGWLRFREDEDMSAVMAELSEKKVLHPFLSPSSSPANLNRHFRLFRSKDLSCTSHTTSDLS